MKNNRKLTAINPDAAGIDIGGSFHFVAVPETRDAKPVRKFDNFTADLNNLADWLISCNIKTVAMESTGVYWVRHEMCPRLTGLLMRDNLENRSHEEKQMTAAAVSLTGASSASVKWESIDWKNTEAGVHRLQMRIAKAVSEGRHGKVKALQWLLTHSFRAKLLAVRRVVQNKGGKTPGVDKVVWKTSQQKMDAARSLTRKGYQT